MEHATTARERRAKQSGRSGREAELDRIDAVVGAARRGHGQLVLVSGEPGIGKTWLAEAARRRAEHRGFASAWSACWASDTAPPYWPWRQVVRQLVEAAAGQAVHERLGDELEMLLRNRGPTPASATFTDPLQRVRLHDAFVDLLRAASTERPLLVVVDDFQWATEPDLVLLGAVAPLLRAMPVVVLGTARDAPADFSSSRAATLLHDAARSAERISLGPLDATALEALLAEIAGGLDDAAVAAIARRSQGNPLFAAELLRLVARDGRVTSDRIARALPSTVIEVLSERIDWLEPDTRGLLDLCALAGDEFAASTIATAAGVPVDAAIGALDHAAAARIVAPVEAPARYRFTHPLVRETVAARIEPGRRAALHLALAEVLGAARAAGAAVPAAALAHHYLHAAPLRQAPDAYRWCRAAAEEAMAAAAYEEAVRHVEAAIGVLDDDASAGDRADTLVALGDARTARGDLAGARDAYLRAADLARRSGAVELLALAALGLGGRGFEVAMTDRTQVDLLGEALAALDGGAHAPVLRSRVAAHLSVALGSAADPAERRTIAQGAVDLARSTGDDRALAAALAAYCDAVAGPEHADERAAAADQIVLAARRAGDTTAELLGHRLGVVAAWERGDVAAVDAHVARYERVAGPLRQPLYLWYPPLWRAARAHMAGRLTVARRAWGDAREVGCRAGSANAEILTAVVDCFLALWEDDPAPSVEGLVATLAGLPEFAQWNAITFPWLWALVGRTDDARADLAVLTREHVDALPVDSEWLPTLAQLAEAISLTGGHPLAEHTYALLLDHRERFAVEGIGAGTHGSVERHLGLLAAALGRPDDARAHFAAARAANGRAGAALLVAAVDADEGRTLYDEAATGRAVAALRGLGLAAAAARVLARAAPARGGGVRAAAHPSPPEPSAPAVFRRDGSLWTLSFAGTTAHVADRKGMHDLARLLAVPGREIAAVDLVAGGSSASRRPAGDAGLSSPGDTGELLDARARAAYRQRLADVEEEHAQAEADHDIERAAQLAAERDALVDALRAAVGLRGPRRSGSAAERARGTVTWRIRDAIEKIAAVHPRLGAHLRHAVRTGTLCAYEPETPVEWEL